MKTFRPIAILLILLLTGAIQPLAGQQSDEPLSLGSISFPSSADGKAEKEFLTGVLALHSFWYPEARDHFRRARELDPAFAMAYWGEAMTHDHPIWGQHDQQAGMAVLNALDRRIADENVRWSEREKAYVKAVRALFDPGRGMDERRRAYAEAMKRLSESYPEDDEALAFSALADLSLPSHDYDNPEPEKVVAIASRLENLYQRNPEHPGAMHYLIHTYDNDTFAPMGLRPADDYAGVAYSSSHAIHMPSHIYKQMGMWQKVIEANISAWEASVEWQRETDRPLRDRDYHSYNWLFDAYMQVGDARAGCEMIANMESLQAKAESRGEDAGRIPSVLDHFETQYRNEAPEGAPACAVGK